MSEVLEFMGTKPMKIKLDNGTVLSPGDRVRVVIPAQRQRKQPLNIVGNVSGFGTHVHTVIVHYSVTGKDGSLLHYTIRPYESYVQKEATS